MATQEALAVILRQWADIEALLTVEELTRIANMGGLTMRGAGPGEPEAVLDVIRPVLANDHPVWDALASEPIPVVRSMHYQVPGLEIAERAQDALASPWVAADQAADALAAASRQAILSFGALPADDEADISEVYLLAINDGGRRWYPSFQFETTDPRRQYPVVAALWSALGADEDPAGAAAWWLMPNPWLAARPADLLGTPREAELGYAADQLASDSW
jgi:hypothetical protein